jgi:3-hydroxybutyryl-CoA dehydrogenase
MNKGQMVEIKNIFVAGAGQMGNGIAQVCAQAGFKVVMRDISDEILDRGMDIIKKSLSNMVKKGIIKDEDRKNTLNRLIPTKDLSLAKDADVVIEAVPEKKEVKQKVFKELDNICPERTIFASNTSSISITTLAKVTNRPDRVVGMHFMYPVPLMKLIEIVKGYLTSDETLSTIKKLSEDLGKEYIVAKDYPAFLSTRLAMPFFNEAFYLLYEGMGTKEDIDKAARLALNHPMGPLELADFIGLDSILSILKIMYEGYGDSKYYPCPLLSQLVEAGHLGRKSGKGVYDYTGGEKK